MADRWLEKFVAESNRVEGILETLPEEIEAHERFLALDDLTVQSLVDLVGVLQPDAELRDRLSVSGVQVGHHVAPPSGPEIRHQVEQCLALAAVGGAHSSHCAYERLHPFTDGNGRSGRALWLWAMLRRGNRDARMAKQLGFLHSFYYQTLAAGDRFAEVAGGRGF